MSELDRIARAFGCHAPSMASLALRSRTINFKLTHYRRSPAVAAPSNSAVILRSFSRSCPSFVMAGICRIAKNAASPASLLPRIVGARRGTKAASHCRLDQRPLCKAKQRLTEPQFPQPHTCVCQLDLAPFDALIWPHLVFA